ncbi:hypothetical protein CPB85DRAFT_1419185, partial [Mucidula mucida]
MPNLTSLFQPFQLTLRNRVLLSAMTRNRSVPTTVPNDVNVEYYRLRAALGAGLIVAEGTLITQQGSEWQNAPGLWSDGHVKGCQFPEMPDPGYQYAPVTGWEKLLNQLEMIAFQRTSGDARVEFWEEGQKFRVAEGVEARAGATIVSHVRSLNSEVTGSYNGRF